MTFEKEDALYKTSVVPHDGFAIPSNEPGFGITLNEEAIAKFAVDRSGAS